MKILVKIRLKFSNFDQYAKLVEQADLVHTLRNEIEDPIPDH
jgi:hypothetical protein